MLDMAPQFNDIPTIPKAKSRRRSVSICGARASGAGAGAPRATAGKEPPMLEMSRRADFSEIPIVDIGALGGGGSAESAVVAAIRDAAENVGFFYAANHGIALAEIRGMFAACERFFALPQARRDAIYLVKSPNYRGYLPIGVLGQTDRPRDLLESFNVGRELGPDDPDVRAGRPLHGANQWPDDLPGFRDAIIRYYGLMDGLMRRLLQGFAMAAGLPRDGFDPMFRKPLTQMRLMHYPAQEVAQGNMIGARAHRDFGFFTILLQDEVGGLEVSNQAGEWVVAPPMEGTFVINVAEMLKLVTNGRFASALHRVINRYGRERYSVPFFVNPGFDAVLEPLPQFVDAAHPAAFDTYPVGEKMLAFYRGLWPSAGKVPA
jgi:isopenicillin N synthase-like dioxygenase